MNLPKPIVVLLAFSIEIFLPVNVLLNAFWGYYPSLLQLLIGFFIMGGSLLLVYFCAYWEHTSIYLRYVYLGLFLIAVLTTIPQTLGLPWLPKDGWMGIGTTNMITCGAVFVLLVSMILGAFPKDEPFPLAFPMQGGRYLIAEGGDGKWSFLLNYHYGYGQHRRSQSNRSMRYAVDIIKINRWGMANQGFLPGDVQQYFVYGESVYSPCEGEVVWAENMAPDNVAYSGKYPYGIGNGVIIRQGQHYAVLGHFQAASVSVKVGDRVTKGQYLGKIGNAGFTHRPHLHLQVSTCEDGNYWAGRGVPIHFGRRFPTKNLVFCDRQKE